MSSSSTSSRQSTLLSKSSVTEATLRREIDAERHAREKAEMEISELEIEIRRLEGQVLKLESGHYEAEELQLAPSEEKQRYEHQRQLNLQLEEQKRWLEHELEALQVRMQSDKLHPMLNQDQDWDNLSETELKRLVNQLERTKNDLLSELEEKEARLNKAGREFHHNDDFCQIYRAEVKNLNRTLEMLLKVAIEPAGLKLEDIDDQEISDPVYPLQPILAKAGFSPKRTILPKLDSPSKKSNLARISPVHKARSVRNLPKIGTDFNEDINSKSRSKGLRGSKKRFQSLSPDRKL